MTLQLNKEVFFWTVYLLFRNFYSFIETFLIKKQAISFKNSGRRQEQVPWPGADPGFPVGGGANPPGGREAPTYDFAKFCEKLHEIDKILAVVGGRPRRAPPQIRWWPTVSYCASPVSCTAPVPFPCCVNKPLNFATKKHRTRLFLSIPSQSLSKDQPTTLLLLFLKEHLYTFSRSKTRGMNFNFPAKKGTGIERMLPHASSECISLIYDMCSYDPDERISAKQALKHHYFKELRWVLKHHYFKELRWVKEFRWLLKHHYLKELRWVKHHYFRELRWVLKHHYFKELRWVLKHHYFKSSAECSRN